MTDKEREYYRDYRKAKRDEIRQYMKEYRQKNKEKLDEYQRQYYAENRERLMPLFKKYRQEHRDEQNKRVNDYHQTKYGRATNLLSSYVQFDTKYKGWRRPHLTQDDIIRKCFNDGCKCVFCGETSWRKLGLDRINNDLPHDALNTMCCCHSCNCKRQRKGFEQFLALKGFGSFDDWMETVGAIYGPDALTVKYHETNDN